MIVCGRSSGTRSSLHAHASDSVTPCQVAQLDALGFSWELSAAAISKIKSKAGTKDAQWKEQLVKLKRYKADHGHCSVPLKWATDPKLGRWVEHQRRYKRALDRGEPNMGMTAARLSKLDALGFVWEASELNFAWEVQLARLKKYKAAHGDCNVPRAWPVDPKLGGWLHHQRQGKKMMDRGESSGGRMMTVARVAKLDALGLAWTVSRADLMRDEAGLDEGRAAIPHCRTLSFMAHGIPRVYHSAMTAPPSPRSAGRRTSPSCKCTRWRMATATCRRPGPRTRSWRPGSSTSGHARRRWTAANLVTG